MANSFQIAYWFICYGKAITKGEFVTNKTFLEDIYIDWLDSNSINYKRSHNMRIAHRLLNAGSAQRTCLPKDDPDYNNNILHTMLFVFKNK